MKIIIPAEKDSCLRKKLNIDLGNYTVLAGLNNSGKTSIVRALMKHKDLSDYEKIHIPAENVKPKEVELKNTATGDSFYKIIEDILKPIFDKNILNNLVEEFDKSSDRADFIKGINSILRQFGVDKKEFDIKIPQDKFKEGIIVKIAKGIVRDLYKTDIEEVDIDNIGMGTQRLIIAALIQYYESNKISGDKKIFLIMEEPEIYLHPKWKSNLHDALVEFSKNENKKVLITTHDPYFIGKTIGQRIYKVFRDENQDDATDIREIKEGSFLLPYTSSSEINYFVFDLVTKTYFLELYQNTLDLFKVKNGITDEKEGMSKFNEWIICLSNKNIRIDPKRKNNPMISKTRNSIGHPREATSIKGEDLIEGIEEMKILRMILNSLKNNSKH